MSIFSRFSDIINSNINSLLDKAEDPEKMVQLIIQEMEETLVEVRTNSARMIADQKELARHKKKLNQHIDDWEHKAEIAMGKDREDLARSALAEKLKLQERSISITEELEQIDKHLESLREEIGLLQQKLTEAKTRQNSLIARHQTADSKLKIRKSTHNRKVEDTMNKLDQYERRLDDLEGRVESYDISQQSLADEIDQLDKDVEIDNELAKIKNRMNNATNIVDASDSELQ
ncbi:MAG: phage shock protein A [Gammaproteobacteria bacterium]|jgi:phage shock protein A